MHKSLWSLFFFLILIRPAFPEGAIEISDAWVNEAPPTVKVLAGYLTICNDSDNPVNLTAVKSPDFEKTEFHLTIIRDGVASMQKQNEIIIPAHSDFSFSPGKYHLMLFNPAHVVKNGDSISLNLSFSNGKSVTVEAEIKRGDREEHHHH